MLNSERGLERKQTYLTLWLVKFVEILPYITQDRIEKWVKSTARILRGGGGALTALRG